MLRRLAPTIPFELLEEFIFMGVDEIAQRLSGYADQGCGHVIFADLTGLVAGANELQARMKDASALRRVLANLSAGPAVVLGGSAAAAEVAAQMEG